MPRIYIDLTAIRYNINYVRSLLNLNTKLIFMVKANAYNHGAIRVSAYVESLIDSFGVANVKEGCTLRKFGIKKEIKVMSFLAREVKDAITFNLTPAISNFETLKAVFNEKSCLEKRKTLNFDLKLDTGMNRLGFKSSEIEKLSAYLNLHKISPMSIHSHFYSSEEKKCQFQYNNFLNMLQGLKITSKYDKIISNSNGLLYYKNSHCDGVRLGIGGYGYGEANLKPAMFVTAEILDIKILLRGESVSYGGLYTATTNIRTAVIRIGYYDGVLRSLTGANVYINGFPCKIIGAVCMDLSIVELGEVDAKIGDEVIVLGHDNNAEYLANHAKTIPYEILTSFKGRGDRIYLT